jgi:hypothetical protein
MAVTWREVDPSSPSYMIAGRSDSLPDGTGDAVGAVIQWGASTLNRWSLQSRIQSELAAQQAFAERICPARDAGGVLALVLVDHRRVDAMESDGFLSCFVIGAFAQARHGIYRYLHSDRMEAAGGGENRRIYFWGTRS